MEENERSGEKVTVKKRSKNIPKSLLETIKQEYLKGTSLSSLAQTYNVSQRALEVRSSRDKWRKSEERVATEIVQVVKKREDLRLERLHSHEENMVKRMFSRLEMVDKTISQIGELVEPQDIKSIVGSEAVIDQVIRRNLGANDNKTEVSGSVEVNIVGLLRKVRAVCEDPANVIDVDVEACKLAADKLREP